MLLDRTSRNVLKFLTSNTPNMEDYLFTADFVAQNCGLSVQEVYSCVRFLSQKDLVRIVEIDYPTVTGKAVWGFDPTHKAFHYLEFEVLDIVETILKSVLLPIVVSLITALLIA